MQHSYDTLSHRLQPPVRILVVDGCTLSRERVRALVERRPNALVSECAVAQDALQLIEADSADLIIIDASLAELEGVAVLAVLKGTGRSHAVYAAAEVGQCPGGEVHALDYLRKPFTDERFDQVLRQACEFVERRLADQTAWLVRERFVDQGPQLDPHRDCLVVKDDEKGIFHLIQATDIDWIEAKDGGVIVHAGKETFTSRHTLMAVQQRLDQSMFLRIHRSYLVNHKRIRTLKPLWKGEYVVTLTCGKSLCTGRSYRTAVESMLK